MVEPVSGNILKNLLFWCDSSRVYLFTPNIHHQQDCGWELLVSTHIFCRTCLLEHVWHFLHEGTNVIQEFKNRKQVQGITAAEHLLINDWLCGRHGVVGWGEVDNLSLMSPTGLWIVILKHKDAQEPRIEDLSTWLINFISLSYFLSVCYDTDYMVLLNVVSASKL